MVGLFWNFDKKSGEIKSGIETDISSKENKSGSQADIKSSELNQMNQIKETAGGFYLYDKENQPILNDQEIEIDADEKLELNIECVNACDVRLNYRIDEDVEGKTMFAYMYESCADREDTYVTNLYRLN